MSRRRMPLSRSLPDWLNILLIVSASVSLLALLVRPATAQTRNPYSASKTAAKAGEYEFRINCALCHGLGARGGGRGPDLTRAHKIHGDSDRDLFRNISQGIPGTVMPANGTNGQGVGRRDLADHHLPPKCSGQGTCEKLRQCRKWKKALLWRRQLLPVPHGERKRRANRTRPDRGRNLENSGIIGGIRSQSQPTACLGTHRAYEGICPTVRDRDGDDAGG